MSVCEEIQATRESAAKQGAEEGSRSPLNAGVSILSCGN